VSEPVLVCVAWPYANGPVHVGQVAGAYLPADIFARYHRTRGDRVLMVSGSDSHGTPITVRAEQENVPPETIFERYHASFLDSWERFGISFDLFTSTHTDNHFAVAQDIFRRLYERGDIYKATMLSPYCPTDRRFLPDRYVEGECPICHYPSARGDQCDNCGNTLDPTDLINPRCRLDGTTPEIRETEHCFLRLSAYNRRLLDWVRGHDYWKPNVLNPTVSFLEGGLKDRAITRDLLWGIPVPIEGFEGKRIYVWFEAVIGYLSASIQWAKDRGEPEAWRPFWEGASRAFYFLGKDNIPFHTVIWPAMLTGYGGLNLPYDVPANEYMNLEGQKISSSRNWAVWLPDYLDRYEPDPLRYYLAATMPETADSDFSWAGFVRKNNDELVATWGNLVHRVLTFSYRNFEGRVPEPGPLSAEDAALLERRASALAAVGEAIGRCRFKEALRAAMALAQETNRYLDAQAPWATIKADRAHAGTSLWVALQAINTLKTALYPFLPFSGQRLHAALGFEGEVQAAGWEVTPVPAGQTLPKPEPLFKKLDDAVAEAENARLGQAA
jgi:methionyl-tRNA synthetase